MISLEGLPGVLYSRKSRKDIEAEKDAAINGRPYDTLEKHRDELFRMSRDYKLHVVDLLEEVVSGEYIAERPKMLKVLEMLAEGSIKWVGVMDEDRLGRGDKIDQGRIERAFKESGAYIITPSKIVDMQDEADELYMDYKGMGARYEYKQTKKRLHGGRKRSAARGNYVGTKPPYGYLRGIDIKTQFPELVSTYVNNAVDMDNLKLYPHPIEADFVRSIFSWFISGVTMADIVVRLNNLTPSPTKKTDWRYHTVHRILKHPVYTGTIRFGFKEHTKLETGKYRYKKRDNDKIQFTENAHEALVSKDNFEKVQHMISANFNPPINRKKKLVNPMATLLKCHYCGMAISYRIYYAKVGTDREPLILCRNPLCKENHAVRFKFVEMNLIRQIEEYYGQLVSETSYNKKIISSNNQIEILSKQKDQIEKKIEQSKEQLDTAHDLLERKMYTPEVFFDRQSKINDKLKSLQDELEFVETLITKESTTQINNKELIPRISNVISLYNSSDVESKNRLLKSIIDAIYYAKPEKGGSRKSPIFNINIIWKDKFN